MKVTLKFECGDRACAIRPGEFCQFTRSKSFGQKYECYLFQVDLFAENGWLQRCTECLALSEKKKKEEDENENEYTLKHTYPKNARRAWQDMEHNPEI